MENLSICCSGVTFCSVRSWLWFSRASLLRREPSGAVSLLALPTAVGGDRAANHGALLLPPRGSEGSLRASVGMDPSTAGCSLLQSFTIWRLLVQRRHGCFNTACLHHNQFLQSKAWLYVHLVIYTDAYDIYTHTYTIYLYIQTRTSLVTAK